MFANEFHSQPCAGWSIFTFKTTGSFAKGAGSGRGRAVASVIQVKHSSYEQFMKNFHLWFRETMSKPSLCLAAAFRICLGLCTWALILLGDENADVRLAFCIQSANVSARRHLHFVIIICVAWGWESKPRFVGWPLVWPCGVAQIV